MSITLSHSAKEACMFTLSAAAEIEYDETKSYKLSLQIVNSRTKHPNPLSSKDVILTNGKGMVTINFDYSDYIKEGITIKATAVIVELPPAKPHSDPVSAAVPGNLQSKIIETGGEDYRLFGLYDCLDHIDFKHNFSYRQQAASSPVSRSITAHAGIYLQNDYCLLSIADDSADLTYTSVRSGQITPEWNIIIVDNQVTFQAVFPDNTAIPGFSGFRFEAVGSILHRPSGLNLLLPFLLDNR